MKSFKSLVIAVIFSSIVLTSQVDVVIDPPSQNIPNFTEMISCVSAPPSDPLNCQKVVMTGNFSCCQGKISGDNVNMTNCIFINSNWKSNATNYVKEQLKLKDKNVVVNIQCANSFILGKFNIISAITLILIALLI
jgi:hypothetical protein